MATTTTNYGFDIPQSTDLVKQGATARATVGHDRDTAMNTALGTKKAGMVLLNTTSFSGVASQSVNNVFSATYQNYLINFEAEQTTGTPTIGFRLRVGGVDDTSSNYIYSITGLNTTPATDNLNAASQSSALFTRALNAFRFAANMNFFNPALAVRTSFTSISQGLSASGVIGSFTGAGSLNINTAFDGITFIASTGTMTGTIRVYGYQN